MRRAHLALGEVSPPTRRRIAGSAAHASSFFWSSGSELPDLVEEDRPRAGLVGSYPVRSGSPRGRAAASGPSSSDSKRWGRDGGEVDGDEPPLAPGAEGVDQLGDPAPSRARLSEDEDRDVGLGERLDPAEDLGESRDPG